jgi:hypothetical protein
MEVDRRSLSELIMDAADRAVTEGVPEAIARQLDDDNLVIPLAVDIDGDVAMATLLTWTEQNSGWEPGLFNGNLVKRKGEWFLATRSSGAAPRDYPLADRRPADPPGLHIRVYDAGAERSSSGGKSWLKAAIHVTAEVETLRIGSRHRTVPFHGYLPVVVRNPAEAVIEAVGSGGSVLETIDLRRDPSDLYRELRQRVPDAWPFKMR